MNFHSAQPWLPVDRIDAAVQLEPMIMIVGLAVAAFIIYRIFLRRTSISRHASLRRQFINLGFHTLLLVLFFGGYESLGNFAGADDSIVRIRAYFGLLAIFSGATIFVKTWRILVSEYLFLGHMKEGVPLVLVNIFTLALALTVGAWIASEIFALRLTPFLATSAVLSVVFGLAMQDTLGNLVAAVAMQFDKPFEIGDWIEVNSSGQKWVGQVEEITWRATTLISFTEEFISIPNRVLAQAQVSNYSARPVPVLRSQVFRIPYGFDPARVRGVLEESARQIEGLAADARPLVIITETTESWVSYKLVYSINDFGAQYLIADRVIAAALQALARAGIPVASQRLVVEKAV